MIIWFRSQVYYHRKIISPPLKNNAVSMTDIFLKQKPISVHPDKEKRVSKSRDKGQKILTVGNNIIIG
jgi:hypothetical protein